MSATAKAALTKAKAAFQKIKPKFGESITIAGEPVYLDMPEDASKVHANRIYLQKYYLPDEIISDDVKILYKRFITEKKVASCEKVHLDILKKGLLHRLQTIEGEAADVRVRGNSISLRERLGHAQKLRDLLEIVESEVRFCADKAAAEARRKAEEAAAAAAAAADNRPPPLTEEQIRTLVKKFAVLILHAKDPVESDRPRLNRPAKNLIAKLDAVPVMANPEVDAFKSTHMSNPLLLRILELGQVGFESFDYTYTMNIYTKLLQEIIASVPEEFTRNLPEDAEPHHKIFSILQRITEKGRETERQLLACNTQAAGLQKRIEELGAQVVAAEKAVKQDPALVAERDTLKADLQREREELEKVRKEIELLQGERDACTSEMSAIGKAAREAAAVAAARIAELETAAKVSAARIAELEKGAGDAAASKKTADEAAAAVTAQLAGLQAQIASLEAGVPVAAGAAAAAAAEIARLTSELEAATKQKADADAAVALADAATDAARAALAEEQGKHAATKTELEQVRAAIGDERAAKEGAEQARDAAREDAEAAAGAAAKTIADLQASLADAQAKVDSAQEGIARIAEQVAAKDADLAAAREEKRKCEEALTAARSGAAAAAGTASEEKARLEAEAERLGGEVAAIQREREALQQQQVALSADGASKSSDLEAARLAIAGLREQVAKYEADVKETRRVTDKRILDLQKQLDDKGTEGAEAVARLQAQMEAARVASAAELDRQLKEQAAANKAEVDRITALLTRAQDQLVALQATIAAAEKNKGKLRENLGLAAKALSNKTRDNAAALKVREAELLGQIGKGQAALAEAQEKGRQELARVTEESQAALRKKSGEMDELLRAKTDEIAGIRAAAAAAAAEAKRLSDGEITKMRDSFDLRRTELEQKVAEAKRALSQATANAAADKQLQVDLAVEERRNLLEKQRRAVAESERKCAEAATAAAAAADVKIKGALEDLRRQGEVMKEKEASHAAAVSALEAKHKKELTEALAAAAAAAEARFAEQVKALGGQKESAIAAAVQGARAASAADLEAKLAAAAKAKNAAVSQATAEGRAAAAKEKDAEIVRIRQEGEAASAAAVDAAKKEAGAAFKAREATLAGEKDAAIAAAVAKARETKDAEFKAEKAKLAAAAVVATAAAVAAAKVAASEKTAGEVAKARTEEAAKTKATDLETLKRLAGQVLAGQAKWASYPGANAQLGQLLAKIDGRMSDICALVYFVSYFLNKMIRPSLVGIRGNNTRYVETLVSNIKAVVDRIANTPDRLFELLMTIEPALLLSNKIMPRRDETVNDTMNYVIRQKTDTRIFKELVIATKENIATNIAWQVVRNRKDTEKSMRFIPMENSKQVLFIHRPEVPASDAVQAGIRKKLLRTYSEGGVLSPIPAADAGALQTVINAAEVSQDFITYDVLFLVFLYASKKYIIDNKDSIPCTVPIEIINNSILKDSMVEGQAQAVAAQAAAVPAARVAPAVAPAAPATVARAPAPEPKCVPVNIRRMDKGTPANVIKLSEDHPSIFAADPYCFNQGGMPLESKVELSYIDFQKGLDGVVARFCSGENPTQFQIPPGFRRDENKDKIIPIDSKFANPTFFDLISYKGRPSGPFFVCNNPKAAPKPVAAPVAKPVAATAAKPVAAPQSVAVALQVPALLQQAAESRTGAAPVRPISPAAKAEVNKLLAAAAASNAGQARRASATSVKANANAAVAAAAAAKAATAAWAAPGSGRQQRAASDLVLEDYDSTPAAPPARPAACPVPIPVISAVATPRARSQFTGVVLNSAIATLLKSPPYCLDVEGYASIEAAKKYSIYNMIDLTDKIAKKLPVGQKLPGFDTTPRTIGGKSVASVLINFNNMFPKKAQGYYFLDPPNKTAEQWGGRRTQKKRRQTSKKFTQRKR